MRKKGKGNSGSNSANAVGKHIFFSSRIFAPKKGRKQKNRVVSGGLSLSLFARKLRGNAPPGLLLLPFLCLFFRARQKIHFLHRSKGGKEEEEEEGGTFLTRLSAKL